MHGMEPAQVAERLGLGESRRPATVLKDVEGAAKVWKVDTDSGAWVVKLSDDWGDEYARAIEQAGELEVRAWKAGVAMPEPFIPDAATVGLWQPIGENQYARALRFLDGEHPTTPLAPGVAHWTGATIAALEKLAIPADPSIDYAFNVHPESDWDEWLAQAIDLRVLDKDAARALKDAAMFIGPIIEAAVASPPQKFVVHSDISFANLLLTADGPFLLDFDGAAPGVPWWELIATAFGLDGTDIRTMEAKRDTVDACLAGFAEAGGRIGPTDERAFTGFLAGRLASTAWELWMACGHRGGGPELHAEFTRAVRLSVPALTTMIESVPEWTTWLRA
jgi:Ser/Thr protein kinase RdoA (MazF antagonist)